MKREFSFPVWRTQAGGLVKRVGQGRYIFVEPPDYPGLDIGHEMPEGWKIVPGNELAKTKEAEILSKKAV